MSEDALKELATNIAALQDELKGALEAHAKEIKQTGKANEELSARVASLKTEVDSAKEMLASVEREVKSRAAIVPPHGNYAAESLASRVVDSAEFKAYRTSRTPMSSPIPIGSYHNLERKAGELLTSSAARLIAPARLDKAAGPSQPAIRSLYNVRSLDRGSAEWVEEFGFVKVGSTFSISGITRAGTTATATTATAHGIPVGAQRRVRISGASPAGYNGDVVVRIASSTTFEYTVDSSLSSPATGTIVGSWIYTIGASGAQTEGAEKQQLELSLAVRSATAATIAAYLTASRQVLDDDAQLRSYIDDRLVAGLVAEENRQILYGSGVTPNLQGILTHAHRQTHLWSDGPSGDTKIDALRRAMTKVQDAEYMPTGIVMSPWDAQDIDLTKDGQGAYVLGNQIVIEGFENRQVFGVPVVVSNAIASGTALVGAFNLGAALYEVSGGSVVRFSDSHGSNFTSNLITILAEERLLQAIGRPEAFCEVTFDTAP